MSDDLVAKAYAANLHDIETQPWVAQKLLIDLACEIERLRAALQTSHIQLAAKMAGKSALSDEKHMAILLAALENT